MLPGRGSHNYVLKPRGLIDVQTASYETRRTTNALEAGDTLVITTLDRLGRSTQNMLDFAEAQ